MKDLGRRIKQWFKTTDLQRRDAWALVSLIVVASGVIAESTPAVMLGLVPAFLAGFYLSRESGVICEECASEISDEDDDLPTAAEFDDPYDLRA